jgi:hypothetical protein
MGIPSSLSKEEILSSIELGLGSALAIFKECQIVAPEDHPDPLAINDCMNNVRDAYEDLKLYRQQLQPKQDLSKEQELIKVYDKYIEVLTDEITDLVGMVLPGWESRNVKRGEEARAAIEYAAQQLQPPGTSDAVELLKELCQLKRYKDTVGKDSLYEKAQPELWRRANEFLNSLVQSKQSGDGEK